jgi:hypothetical protein
MSIPTSCSVTATALGYAATPHAVHDRRRRTREGRFAVACSAGAPPGRARQRTARERRRAVRVPGRHGRLPGGSARPQ